MSRRSFRRGPYRRRAVADAVPMINVAFLLLIFFLLVARIAPPDPVSVALPEGAGAPAPTEVAVYLAADGTLAYADRRGAEVFAALPAQAAILVRADRQAEAAALTRLVARLRAAGAVSVSVALAPPT